MCEHQERRKSETLQHEIASRHSSELSLSSHNDAEEEHHAVRRLLEVGVVRISGGPNLLCYDVLLV